MLAPLSPWQFYRATAKRALCWALEGSHWVYFIATLVGGGVIVLAGWHFDKSVLMVTPLVALPILAFVGVWREAYRIYQAAEREKDRAAQETVEIIERLAREHAATVGSLRRRIEELESQAAGPKLSADATRLLLKASTDGSDGYIYFGSGVGGGSLVVFGEQFLTDGSPQDLRRWEAVLEELGAADFIRPHQPGSKTFQVTHAGHVEAVRLRANPVRTA